MDDRSSEAGTPRQQTPVYRPFPTLNYEDFTRVVVNDRGPDSREAHADAPEAPNIFRRKGDFWIVRFNGKETHVGDCAGMLAIHYLLGCPSAGVNAIDLPGNEGPSTENSVADATREDGMEILKQIQKAKRELEKLKRSEEKAGESSVDVPARGIVSGDGIARKR